LEVSNGYTLTVHMQTPLEKPKAWHLMIWRIFADHVLFWYYPVQYYFTLAIKYS
jgi:hypothetical protein